MGGEDLASFFHKVQAVEESFLRLEVKERSRALNILQSSINKLLNFVGDADIVSANLSVSVPDTFLLHQDNRCKESLSSCSQETKAGTKKGNRRTASAHGKRKNVTRVKKCSCKKNESLFTTCDHLESSGSSADSSFVTDARDSQTADVPESASNLQSAAEEAKHETKECFEDDFQELADFDYDFNPNLQHSNASSVSRPGTSHITQCGNKFTGKMLSISTASDGNACPASGAQSAYPEQVLDVAVSHEGGNPHFGGQLLPSTAPDIKTNCHLSQEPQFGMQIMVCSQIETGGKTAQYAGGVVDSSGDPSQYAGGVLDTSGDPSQYAGGVIDTSGDPSQYAGGVIDSSGDPSQYAGGVIDSSEDPSQYAGGVIDSSGDPSQYAGAVIDSSAETSQYTGSVIDSTGEASQYPGGVIEMSDAQEAQICDPSHVHAQYTGAMIPTAQDVTVCTTTQYPGTVLAMSMPETISYSAAQYSHAIMQGLNCGPAHHQFNNTVLDMSAAASRQGEIGISASHSSAQYAGTIFEGAVIGAQASTVCSPFQFRRPMFEPHEAFHRSQELTFMHASMLQQQQLYQLHQQTMTSYWRVFVCRACGESLTHYRSIKAHLRTHGCSPLCCRMCRQRQVNETALQHHLCGGQHWKQSANVSREMFMCRECGKFFISKGKLKIHFETEHHSEMPEDIKYTCRFCGLQLTKKCLMFSHYRQHAGGRFVCRVCGAIQNDFVQYANHMSAHERRRKKLTCQQCSKVFCNHRVLGEHVKTHGRFVCSRCQKVCSSQAALSRHQSRTHSVKIKSEGGSSRLEKGCQCNICGKQFSQVKQLELHSCIHAGEKLLDCTSCKLRFHTRRALTKHRRTLGHCRRTGKPREAQHLCSECGKSYHRRQALHRHLRQHQSSKPFACKYCNFRCSAKENLQRHEIHHFSTQRNFICELCGAAFHAKKTLEMHHNYKHSSERRFKCSECPMSFKARNALSRHAKTHSRSREHGCWCGAAFNRLYNLRRHMRLVHGSDEALPPLRKVEVLDLNQSVKQAISTPPAKKMMVKSRKVKADCMQKEQEAAAAVLVVGGEEESGEEGEGRNQGMEREGVEAIPEVGITSLVGQNQQVGLQNVNNYSAMSAAAASAGGVMAQANVIHPFSHPHPHLTMEQSYAMVSATLHHHHNLHHDPQQTLIATAGGESSSITPHPFPHISHPSLDYSQLPNLSTMVPYSTHITTSNTATTTVANSSAQRQDYYPAGGAGMEGMQQSAAEYTTSPFSFIQNILLPSVGVANLLDLAHASGAK